MTVDLTSPFDVQLSNRSGGLKQMDLGKLRFTIHSEVRLCACALCGDDMTRAQLSRDDRRISADNSVEASHVV
jgi:hypothetical protein